MAYINGKEVVFDPKIGKDGVGVEKIEQTTTSTEDGGVNIITVTLTNGVKQTFEIKNGSRGSTGDTGAQGPQGEKGDEGAQGPQGEKGDEGADGVGVEKIEQTTTSTEDGGVNIITVTLTNGVTQTFEIKNGSGGNVNGDWQQNDSTQADYIKNRPCWKETKGVDVVTLPETSVAFTSGAELVHGFVENSFIEGNKYIVKWNGTEYEAYCYIEEDTYIIGNGVLADMTTETAHPFCIVSFGGSACYVYKDTETDETITIEVNGVKENIVHYLDPKYIPDMYYTEYAIGEVFPETIGTNVDGTFGFTGSLSLVEGNAYKVKYNGVEYECEAKLVTQDDMTNIVMGDVDAMSGVPSGAYPFVLMAGEQVSQIGFACVLMPLDNAESVTISISGPTPIIHKIPEKYLPDKLVNIGALNITDYFLNLLDKGYVHIEDSSLVNAARDIAKSADKMLLTYTDYGNIVRWSLSKTAESGVDGEKSWMFTGVVSEFSNSALVIEYMAITFNESNDFITLGYKKIS